jgi:hypothetical protein
MNETESFQSRSERGILFEELAMTPRSLKAGINK